MNWTAFDNPQSLVLGGLMFVTAFVLWRNIVLSRRIKSGGRFHEAEVPSNTVSRAASQLSQTASTLQVELHDFLREVEGRIAHKTATLDELLRETDAELRRLEGLLETQRKGSSLSRDSESSSVGVTSSRHEEPTVSLKQRRMIGWLAKAGFRAEEIAHFVAIDQRDIERCLNEFPGDGPSQRRAA